MTPRVVVLGGVDPCGGAGITADALAAACHGAQALPVPLVLTEQNRHGFVRCHAVADEVWGGMLERAFADGPVQAIKVGLLAGAVQLPVLAARLAPWRGRVPIVVDPVLSATAGGLAERPALAAAYREHLAPLCTVMTPNAPELEALADGDAAALLAVGAGAVLRKGGHDDGADVIDVLCTPAGRRIWLRPRLDVGRVHGTGCALATAIAVELARGAELESACGRAGDWLHAQLAQLGPGPAGEGGAPPRELPFVARGQSSR